MWCRTSWKSSCRRRKVTSRASVEYHGWLVLNEGIRLHVLPLILRHLCLSFTAGYLSERRPHLHLCPSDLDIQYRAELDRDPEVDKVKVVTQCYSLLEASSNVVDVYKMTNGETASFWQSDGSARSHWIRQGRLLCD